MLQIQWTSNSEWNLRGKQHTEHDSDVVCEWIYVISSVTVIVTVSLNSVKHNLFDQIYSFSDKQPWHLYLPGIPVFLVSVMTRNPTIYNTSQTWQWGIFERPEFSHMLHKLSNNYIDLVFLQATWNHFMRIFDGLEAVYNYKLISYKAHFNDLQASQQFQYFGIEWQPMTCPNQYKLLHPSPKWTIFILYIHHINQFLFSIYRCSNPSQNTGATYKNM